MEWHPIETAPKDGTWILIKGGRPDRIWHDDGHTPPMAVAMWDGEMWRFCSYDGGVYGEWDYPTEWAQLPNV